MIDGTGVDKKPSAANTDLTTSMGITLFLGGVRSGKSTKAEALAARMSVELQLPVCYVATAEVLDDEMAQRVRRHREQRSAEWETIEAPCHGAEAIRQRAAQGKCIFLLDCLTVLVSNWMLRYDSEGLTGSDLTDQVLLEVDLLVTALQESGCQSIIVSNEVGMGVVPAYPLGRAFRDIVGWANQKIAGVAHRAYFVVAGIPIDLKALEVTP